MELEVRKITEDAKLPEQAHKGDMFDVFANDDVEVNSYESVVIPLGIAINIPVGYRIKVFSRSSLPLKKKIIVSNSVGIIDTGYIEEIGLVCHTLPILYDNNTPQILFNNKVLIKKGDKIAQIQLEKIEEIVIKEVKKIDAKTSALARKGGFGSTDKK